MASKRSPNQLAAFLGINVKLIRLITHQASKPAHRNNILTQPFCWIRPKTKDYTQWIKSQDEYMLKKLVIDQLPQHKSLSYETRIEQINQGGLKINYPKLKFLYKKLGISKDQYKEKNEGSLFQKKEQLMKQFEQLVALELANIKMRGQKLVYIDIVKVSLTELQLVLSPISQNELEDPDETYQSIYAQIAIDGDIGLVGFQLYYKMPKCDEMMDFISKVYLKFKDSAVEDTSNPYSKGKWIVLPNNQASHPRQLNEMLKKTGLRCIIMPNEPMNQKLNSARGIWPYLAHIWES